jgi:hypothetical protein
VFGEEAGDGREEGADRGRVWSGKRCFQPLRTHLDEVQGVILVLEAVRFDPEATG